MKVAVTGGSGVVGSAVVRHLVAAGHDVAALSRSREASEKLESLGAVVVRGDVLDAEAVGRLLEGQARVFHVAGVNELCPRDPARMWEVNVEGTTTVAEQAARKGVERMILTSSAVTIGEERGARGHESSLHRGHFLSEYERSKTVGERLAIDLGGELEVVSVNPSSVQGPGRATGTGALLLAAARGKTRFLVDTTFSMVDIDDCARGHLLAAERGAHGERYILSGAVLTVRQVVRMIDSILGRRRRAWFIQPWLVSALAPVVETAFRAIRRRPPLCRESARVLLHGHSYDGRKATRDLGLEYTTVEDTLESTVRWFRDEGML
ncbi:MAG TPA: NAD-dependent epimerase/dehydratase family protein [Acidimicrobiia bacterium]|nr:NAD-dependent epimerase/dehydratase family protein [Acidimicrobiia bacterium]